MNSLNAVGETYLPNINPPKRLNFIDFGKGFAILGIVVFHYSQSFVSGVWEQAIQLGGAGVHLFIIFSGFTLFLASRRLNIVGFYKRRFTKIIIPYYLFVCLVFLIKQVYPIYPEDGLYAFFGHIFWYKMFDESIITSLGYHLWFMSLIIQLYLVYPFLAQLMRRLRPAKFALLAVAVSFCFWTVTAYLGLSELRVFQNSCLSHLWEFALGMAVADAYKKNGNLFSWVNVRYMLVLSVIGIGLKGFMAMQGDPVWNAFNDVPTVIGFGALTVLAYGLCDRWKWVKRGVEFVGKISFELYLVHILVWKLIKGLFLVVSSGEPTWIFKMTFVLPVAVVVAIGFKQLHVAVGQRVRKAVPKVSYL
ncbi:MAG: acyltransferase [Cyanobacteria bacterium J06614_10]